MDLELIREQLYSDFFNDEEHPKIHYLAVDEGVYFLNQFLEYEKNEQDLEAENLAKQMDKKSEDEYDALRNRAFKEGLKKFSERLYSDYYFHEEGLDDLLDEEEDEEEDWRDASEFDKRFVMPKDDILKILKNTLKKEDYDEATIGVDKAYEFLNSYGESAINKIVEYFSKKRQYQWHGFKFALEKLEKEYIYKKIADLLIDKSRQKNKS